MSNESVPSGSVADELEAIRCLKARYCRFLDTKDVDAWRAVFTPDVEVTLDMAVSTGGADPRTAPVIRGVDTFVATVFTSVAGAATMHHCHTPEITFATDQTATGIWAMEDHLVYPDGRELRGAGHYHETYEKRGGIWRIKTLHLTRTILQVMGDLTSQRPASLVGGES